MSEECSAIPFGLYGKEAEEFRKRSITRIMNKHGFSKEEAEEIADIWISSVNEADKESD